MRESWSIVAQTNPFARRTLRQPLLWGRPRAACSTMHKRTRDRSSWHENCVHEARTRRSERGCRIQRQKREITDPSDGEMVKEGYNFEAGPTGCKMSRGNRSMTLDVVKNSLWVIAEAYTTAEGALNADASFVAPVVDGLPEEPAPSSGPITRSFQTARAPVSHQLSTWTVLHQLGTCENGCESYEHQCGVQKHKCGVVCWRDKRLSLDRGKTKKLLNRRRRDLENAIDPTVSRTLK